jgi:hypothetical protein
LGNLKGKNEVEDNNKMDLEEMECVDVDWI